MKYEQYVHLHAFHISISPVKSFYSLLHADKSKLSMNSHGYRISRFGWKKISNYKCVRDRKMCWFPWKCMTRATRIQPNIRRIVLSLSNIDCIPSHGIDKGNLREKKIKRIIKAIYGAKMWIVRSTHVDFFIRWILILYSMR